MTSRNDKSGSPLTQNKTCHTRTMKVCRHFYAHRSHLSSPFVPIIQLKGHWLQQAGFVIDMPITVRVMEGCIVITVEGLVC